MDKENKEYGFINIYVDPDKPLYDDFTELNMMFDDFENIGKALADVADGWRGKIDTLPECTRNDVLKFISRYDSFLMCVDNERRRLCNLLILCSIDDNWKRRYRKED